MAANPGYYLDQSITALTASYVAFEFQCAAGFVALFNDDTTGTNKLQWSYDGTTLHGQLLFGQNIQMQDFKGGAIYLRYSGAAPAYKLIARSA